VVVARVVTGPVVGAVPRLAVVVATAAVVAVPHAGVARPAVVARIMVRGIVGSAPIVPDGQPAVVVASIVPGGIVGAVTRLGRRHRRERERGRHRQDPESPAVSLGHWSVLLVVVGPALRLAAAASGFQLDIGPKTGVRDAAIVVFRQVMTRTSVATADARRARVRASLARAAGGAVRRLPARGWRRSGRSAVAQFAVSGLAIVALLGLAGVELLRHAGSSEALRDAKNNVRLAAEGVAAPNLTPAVLRGDPSALARFDGIMRASVVRPPIVRVKIWSADGRIVYSDARRLIGSRYPFGAGELAILRRGGVDADLSDLSRPENRFERGQGKLLEVYLPIRGPGGRPLLFEGYERQSSVLSSSRRLWLTFAPALIGALLLLQLLQLPLARSLVRRVRRAGAEREALLRHAVEASDLERRRLASILHDGVVQDLTGVSYRLAAGGAEPGDRLLAALARDASAELRRSVQELRSLLVDLYPGGLHGADIGTALAELAAELEHDGVHVVRDVELNGALPELAAELVFRAAREGVRNVLRHAGARTVEIRLSADARQALLEVDDDGVGLAGGAEPLGPKQGHFGLALLRDVLKDSGGDLQLLPGASGGALLRVLVPLG